MTQAKKMTLRIRVTTQVMETIKRLAADRGESVSLICREAINSYLRGANEQSRPKPRAA